MVSVQAPTALRECPKCHTACDATLVECPRCMVIMDKAARTEDRRRARRETETPPPGSPLERLAAADQLMIKQAFEAWEAFLGLETANQYTVLDPSGNTMFIAAEESGSLTKFLGRMFLKAARPFKLHIQTPQGEPVLTLDRPFRFFFDEIQVVDPQQRVLGSIQKRFSLFQKIFTVTQGTNGESYDLLGPVWKPWTFKIQRNGAQCGVILKKWSGFKNEMLSDADYFGIEFPRGIGPDLKCVLLGAVFLIDFVYFEDNN